MKGTGQNLVVREVFEVLYSPVKAFKKITEKPDFKGVLLILVLVMFSTAVAQYVTASKLFLKIETPDDDDLTESISLWASNGVRSNDTDSMVGNYSVKSFVSNGTSLLMNITDIGTFDCSGDTGYEELFFWIKWIHQDGTFPSSGATLRLFSSGEGNYFDLDIIDLISNSSDKWANVTVDTGSEKGWVPSGSPDWKNITGLGFRLTWPASADLTIKIDDLHFRRYVPFLETGTFSELIVSSLMYAIIDFSMNWILWAGVLLLTVKTFHEKGGPWTMFFIIIGHVFSVTVVYTLASTALLSMLPALNLPLKTWPPTTEKEFNAVGALIQEKWYPNWAYQLGSYLPFIREVWTVMLCAIAIRFLCEITWKRAASISVVALVLRSALRFFLGF